MHNYYLWNCNCRRSELCQSIKGEITKMICLFMLLSSMMEVAVKADPAIVSNLDGDVFFSSDRMAQAKLTNNGFDIEVTKLGHKLYKIQTPAPFAKPAKRLSWPSIRSARDLGFLSGNIYLSNDGNTLVWLLLPRFFGHLVLVDFIPVGSYGHRVINPRPNRELLKTPALALFCNGRLKRTYTLEELLVRPELVEESSAHTRWLNSDENAQGKGPRPKLSADGKFFSFETTSFREYVLNIQSGLMVEAKDKEVWAKPELVVRGRLVPGCNNPPWIKIDKLKVLKGNYSQNQLRFIDPTKTYPVGIEYKDPEIWLGVALTKRRGIYQAISPRSKFPSHCNPW